MSILTEEDIRAAGGIVHRDRNVFFTNVEKLNQAFLAKLAGMELPQHHALIGKEERVVTETFVMEGTHYEKVYTAAQLNQAFAQGAASQLSAIKTLEHLGYTNCGGEYWKPPLGKK